MRITMPQEIEVWYIIPAIRRGLAKIMVKEHSLSQKETAHLLNITEPAVSQYLKLKRAKDIKFSKQAIEKLRESVNRIIKKKECLIREIQLLCNYLKKEEVLCNIHKKHDASLPAKCSLCLKHKKNEDEIKNE